MKAILAKQLVLDNQILENYALTILDGRIHSIISKEALEKQSDIYDLDTTDILMAGFIDIHIHGSGGYDVMDATEEALLNIKSSLAQTGTTSFLATTMTVAQERIISAIETVKALMLKPNVGAKIIGVHLEGPFIQKKAKGAHVEAFIQEPTIDWIQAYQDTVKLITLAPETDVENKVLKALKAMNIKVSLGHSTATYDCACQAIDAGADSVTHLFNAMSGLHHRDPGMVGAALLRPVYTELIADGVHVHPDLYELVYKLKGEDKVILITDAMKGQCMKAGDYDLGGQSVHVSDKDARLADGTLAGSILTQKKALKNLMATEKFDLVKLTKMLSANPAALLGLKDIGKICVGAHADLVCLSASLTVQKVLINGICEYHAE